MKPRFLAYLACACLGRVASAAEVNRPAPTQAPAIPPGRSINYPQLPGFLYGVPFTVELRGGIGNYTGTLGKTFRVGPILGVAVNAMKDDLYGVELSFEGGNNGISKGFVKNGVDFTQIPSRQSLWRYNLGAMFKAGPNLGTPIGKFRPYAGAGLGISYANVTDGAEPPYRNDVFGEIPLGGGLEYQFKEHVVVGVRGLYRVLFFDDFAERSPPDKNPPGGMFNVLINAGGRF